MNESHAVSLFKSSPCLMVKVKTLFDIRCDWLLQGEFNDKPLE